MEEKICGKCKIPKPLNEFYRDKRRKDKLNYWCKKCINDYCKKWVKDNTERVKERNKNWRLKNKNELSEYQKQYQRQYYQINKKEILRKNKKYHENNKDKVKEYYQKNAIKTKRYKKEWDRKNKDRMKVYNKEYQKNRLIDNPNLRLNKNMKNAIYRSIKNKNGQHWEKLIGYTQIELRKHLEAQFKDGMTWENYGKWHIDHIIPISLFNITGIKSKGFKKCWALENLQPLWEKDNFKKSNNLFY